MYNPVLDRLPDAYEGYLIRTDFRIGIQISQVFTDNELSDLEKQSVACDLLYGKGTPPDMETAAKGLSWFLNGGAAPDASDEENEQRSFDFELDGARIWSGFRRVYNLDLSKKRLHWFHFLAMLSDLGECAFTDVVGYRVTKVEKLPKDMQSDYRRLKKLYEIPTVLDEESQAIEDEFMAAYRG